VNYLGPSITPPYRAERGGAERGDLMADAVIIPFPGRGPAASSEDRLQAALQSLQAALDEQRRALSDWRFAMTELGIGVAGLGHSLAGYQAALGGVEDKLSDLRSNAAGLEAWADGALATPRHRRVAAGSRLTKRAPSVFR
jgi:hypothetical protein